MTRFFQNLQSHISWKLFLSYLLIIVLGSLALFIGAQLHMPVAFARHMEAMAAEIGDAAALTDDLFANFRQALTESMVIAVLTSTVLALMMSYYISRRVGGFVQEMTHASRRIAAGQYGERIEGVPPRDQQDELDELTDSFNQLAAALERTEAVRRELITNVTHELRTPLTAIQGYMEALMDGVLPPDATTYAKVHGEASRLRRLVGDLQELSRLEEGAYHLELTHMRCQDLVQQAVDHLAPQYAEKGIDLSLEMAPTPLMVRVDKDRVLQILYNLLGNALQYTPAGGQVAVRVRSGTQQRVDIQVRDTGIGIAPEHLPHLFERFYRADPSRSRAGGGTGIGLTIAHHLAQAHGGTITAHSEGPGHGSTFTLQLPLA